jgi:hypothetical protein
VFGAFHRYLDLGSHNSYEGEVVPFYVLNSSNFTIEGFMLNGNVQDTTRDAGVVEDAGAGSGIVTSRSSDYTLADLYIHHFQADGIMVGAGYLGLNSGWTTSSSTVYRLADRNVTIKNVTSTNNARDDLSIIQAYGVMVEDSTFADAGRTAATTGTASKIGAYRWHPPGAGVDVEPDAGLRTSQHPYGSDILTGKVTFIHDVFKDNYMWQMVSAVPYAVTDITVDHCTIENVAKDANPTYGGFDLVPQNGDIHDSTFIFGDHSEYGGIIFWPNESAETVNHLVFHHNIFTLATAHGIYLNSSNNIPLFFNDNVVNIKATGRDSSEMLLYNLASVSRNTFNIDAGGFTNTAAVQTVLSYGNLASSTGTISGNTYTTNLSGKRYYRIMYPKDFVPSNEKYTGNVVGYASEAPPR